MITLHDLEEAIAECQGQRDPNANTCIKLAAFLTIKRELYPEEGASYAPAPLLGESEFARAVSSIPAESAWAIMEELMDTVQVLLPRVYDGVMRKLKAEG